MMRSLKIKELANRYGVSKQSVMYRLNQFTPEQKNAWILQKSNGIMIQSKGVEYLDSVYKFGEHADKPIINDIIVDTPTNNEDNTSNMLVDVQNIKDNYTTKLETAELKNYILQERAERIKAEQELKDELSERINKADKSRIGIYIAVAVGAFVLGGCAVWIALNL